MKKILVTGAAGFIGSYLCTKLVHLGYNVLAVDILKYNKSSLFHLFKYKNFKFLNYDVSEKKLIKEITKSIDFVIPLAALVGAPLCEKNKQEAKKINYDAIVSLVKILNKNQKVIYPNTNSGYGVGKKNSYCDENSELNPVSLYGLTKNKSEKYIMENHKNAVCFRLATVFGYSYRMRTDLIVNNFVYTAIKEKKLSIFEPHFRRNFIHIDDIAEAFIFTIKNFNRMKGQVYNLGLNNANITKLELAKKIKNELKKTKILINNKKKDPDKRDYFVSNKKLLKAGFKAKTSLDSGIKELVKILKISDIKFLNNY